MGRAYMTNRNVRSKICCRFSQRVLRVTIPSIAMPLFDEDPYRGLRRVIDISGDGPNNNGAPVTGARDEALSKGIVINGLDWYYEDCVIGGPGSFVIPIKDREKFKEAIRLRPRAGVCRRSK
jgi:Protein of unknown function (DUF1194)